MKPFTWHQNFVGWTWLVGSVCTIVSALILLGGAGLFAGVAVSAFAACVIEICDPSEED